MNTLMTEPIVTTARHHTARNHHRTRQAYRIVAAQRGDSDMVISLFGALHTYNASLDTHFGLSDEWEELLRHDFCQTCYQSDKMWLLVKDGVQAVGLLIAVVHTDSPLFRYRRWIEIEALYVADSHRGMGIAQDLLQRAYGWAQAQGLARVQLYVTATNVRAQAVYHAQGFAMTQAIMRKTL